MHYYLDIRLVRYKSDCDDLSEIEEHAFDSSCPFEEKFKLIEYTCSLFCGCLLVR